MRNLEKLPIPRILSEKHDEWLAAFIADKTNPTNRYRYRESEIKDTLKQETGWKCVYCESKIGHTTPGDIEHKIPSSKDENLHFNWDNLTIACTECNRRKNDYYESGSEFLDPYSDDVEHMVEHYGPIMGWRGGDKRAEITIKKLELDTNARFLLISRKVEKIEELNNVIERYIKESSADIKALMKEKIKRMINKKAEYSAMILSVINIKGLEIG
ncbi:MAG TPA: HNH endonuclease [Dehalococcoidia bacterium]|nr:HNH endonuclease [Dehalococcoidia bacterium]